MPKKKAVKDKGSAMATMRKKAGRPKKASAVSVDVTQVGSSPALPPGVVVSAPVGGIQVSVAQVPTQVPAVMTQAVAAQASVDPFSLNPLARAYASLSAQIKDLEDQKKAINQQLQQGVLQAISMGLATEAEPTLAMGPGMEAGKTFVARLVKQVRTTYDHDKLKEAMVACSIPMNVIEWCEQQAEKKTSSQYVLLNEK